VFPEPWDSIARYGFLGVQLFFVISGYCISHAVAASGFREYLWRRFVRIFPPYWAALAFAVLLRFLIKTWVPAILPADFKYWFSQIFLAQGISGIEYFVNVYWTLHIELQFYLVMGTLAFFGVLIPGAHGIALIALPWLFSPAIRDPQCQQFLLTFWLQLYCGVILFDLTKARRTGQAGRILFNLSILALIFFTGMFLHKIQQQASAVFAALIFFLFGLKQGIFEKKLWGPFAWLGRISYSLYLVHNPIIGAVWRLREVFPYASKCCEGLFIAACLGAAVGVGFLFYKLAEEPAARWRRRGGMAPAASVKDPAPP
jgi:peptidoglycan/LPS O-acetylase OafA/YrhL